MLKDSGNAIKREPHEYSNYTKQSNFFFTLISDFCYKLVHRLSSGKINRVWTLKHEKSRLIHSYLHRLFLSKVSLTNTKKDKLVW